VKALLLTNEYPPTIYGGAGVHIDYLSRELAQWIEVDVRTFGNQVVNQGNLHVQGFPLDTSTFRSPKNLNSVLGAVRRCTDFNIAGIDAQVVHCHTWYSHLGGILAKLNYGIPLVITIHSLEPLRPWKREQLGHGYDFSCWVEKTAIEMADAIIAVSEETKRDVQRFFNVPEEKIKIIYNGIDPEEYQPTSSTTALTEYGIDPHKPFVLFVGRIARQKGIIHLVRAIQYMEPGFQIVLCAGAPDTPEIAEEMKQAVIEAKRHRNDVIWIEQMVPKKAVYQLYGHAAVFCCPSIYEPFGIINLEAMACETAVVASAVGGIKEVVVDGETGYLVPLDQMSESPFEPVDPQRFAKDFATKVNDLMRDPAKREKFGKAGRKRAIEKFSWKSIAAETIELYEQLQGPRCTDHSLT
jgi:alpha-maltose-1-phosphate synthase